MVTRPQLATTADDVVGSTTPATGGGGVDEVEAGGGNGKPPSGAVASMLGGSDSSEPSPLQDTPTLCGLERLTSAVDVARSCGARWLVSHAARLTSVDIVADSVTGADGPLTTRELHVASLVADGLTNREIAA